MEPPDPSFVDEFNLSQEHAGLVFDIGRAAVLLPFQVYRLQVLVEAGVIAFPNACFGCLVWQIFQQESLL